MKLQIKTCVLAVIIGLQLSSSFGQSVYFKTGGAFHLLINRQESPDLFSFIVNVQPGSGNSSVLINQKNYEFSLAEGVSFNGAVGCSLNKNISLELGLSYFNNTKKEFEADQQSQYSANSTTTWRFKNYSIHPTIVVGQTMNRSTINANFNFGIGFSSLRINALFDNAYCEYSFSNSFSYGYGYGIEYLYQASSTLQWYIQGGISNTYYSPTHAELTSSSSDIASLNVYQREIDYVKEINNLQVPYNYSLSKIYTDSNKPEVRLRETIKLNSFFVGIGIKYTLSKHEKE
jgi:hypothetical protein